MLTSIFCIRSILVFIFNQSISIFFRRTIITWFHWLQNCCYPLFGSLLHARKCDQVCSSHNPRFACLLICLGQCCLNRRLNAIQRVWMCLKQNNEIKIPKNHGTMHIGKGWTKYALVRNILTNNYLKLYKAVDQSYKFLRVLRVSVKSIHISTQIST